MAKEWISALVDGETVDDPLAVERHVQSCADCQDFQGATHRLKRTMALRPISAQPVDLAAGVMARASTPRLGRGEWRRTALAAAGLTLLLLSIPGVLFGSTVLGESLGASDHSGRHLGAFSAALAFGFIYAAWRPERAIGLVPLTTVLGALILLTGTIDLLRGTSSGLAEAGHLLELAGVYLVWEISGGRLRPRWPTLITP